MGHPIDPSVVKQYGESVIQAGLDLGKVHDYAVITITECQRWYLGRFPDGENPSYYDDEGKYHPSVERLKDRWETRFLVRYLERMALGTPYLAIGEHIANVFASGAIPNVTQQHLYADATGVGMGVVELIGAALKEKLSTRDVSLRPITITYGQGEYRFGSPTVTKHGLVTRLLELMATDTIKVAKSLVKDVPLIDELKAFQERVAAETGNTSFGGRGAHDDTVISLCLSVITDPFKYRVTYGPRFF